MSQLGTVIFTMPGANSVCSGMGAEEPLSREKLVSLYGDHHGYRNRLVQQATELEREGWLLPADAEEMRQNAATFGWL